MQNRFNPNMILQQMMRNPNIANNPIAKNALDMYQRGDVQGLNNLANNLCNEKGVSFEDMKTQIRSKMGI